MMERRKQSGIPTTRRAFGGLLLSLPLLALGGCGGLPGSGPAARRVRRSRASWLNCASLLRTRSSSTRRPR